MNDFDFDCMEKKRIARGAMHKKRAGGHHVSLPSDYLTAAQKRKLNGEVVKMKLGEPITWEGFNRLPDALQREYIDDLKAKFGATDRMLSQMFLKSEMTIAKARNELGIDASKKGFRPTQTQKFEWKEFLTQPYQDTGEQIKLPMLAETANDAPPAVEETRPVLGVCKVSGKIVCQTWDDIDRVKDFLKTLPKGFTFTMEFENGDGDEI